MYTCKLDGVDFRVFGCGAVRCGGALTVGCPAALLLVGVTSGNLLFATSLY